MKNKPLWIGLAVVVVLGLYAMTFHNGMVSVKNQIKAAHENNQQVYSSIRIQIEQSGGVANEYSNKVIEALKVGMTGRYGPKGSQASMQWIREQNPNIDPSVYKKIQQIVEVSYSRFEANQTTLIDKGRIFQDKLEKVPGSILAGLLGWSMADIEKYMTILKSADAKRDFATGTMTAPSTFGK